VTERRFFVAKIEGRLHTRVGECLEFLNWEEIVGSDSRVFVKPNLTYPHYKPGVTTSPEFLRALISILRTRTSHITIGESDGGYHSWKAEEAFAGHNLDVLSTQYDVQLINLSRVESLPIEFSSGLRRHRIFLPTLLLRETDVFISVPVPKMHCMTGVSLGMKNQWGCIPDTLRLLHHHIFDRAIVEINKMLRPQLILGDGQFMLDGNGPMYGRPVPMDLVLGANHLGTFEYATCVLMGVRPNHIGHLRLAQKQGLVPRSLAGVRLSDEVEKYRTHDFHAARTLRNWAVLPAFHSHILTRLLYVSRFGRAIHKVWYGWKGKPGYVQY
jgi:uncharacterized protein (DUF362 family)